MDNKTQAEERSNIDPMEKNKGSEAAQAALDMVDLDWL